MSTFRLNALFNPKSIAVIGATARPNSLGMPIMRNLISGNFQGPILPVNPGYDSIHGILCYKSIEHLPIVPDLALLCTPPGTVMTLIDKLGQRGTRVVIIMTTEFNMFDSKGENNFKSILTTARKYGMRVLGPSSTGIQVPRIGLNASWISTAVKNGKLAFVSQSGSFTAAVMEWASLNGIGFSNVISTGDTVDIDFGDILDFVATDSQTSSILLNIRSIENPRKFLSAARAVARIKPVIVIKAARRFEKIGIRGDHDFSQILEDEAYDAAIRRAGMLRVYNTYELFDAVETLTYGRMIHGDSLAIVCNGISPGDMAADALIQGGGKLAELSEETVQKISVIISKKLFRTNPIDLGREANAVKYRESVSILLDAPEVDAVLVMYTPTPVTQSSEIAAAISEVAGKSRGNLIACWLGENRRDPRHNILTQCGIPVYVTPDEATRAFLHLIRYRKNQEMLMETPLMLPEERSADRGMAKEIVTAVLSAGRKSLNEEETSRVLNLYGINTLETQLLNKIDDVLEYADREGYPVSLRLSSPTLRRELSVGNISFDLSSRDAVEAAAEGMDERFYKRYQGLPHPGYVVQKMTRRPEALLLSMGISNDPLFGPFIRFGRGGAPTGIPGDYAVALPPLNMSLAGELIAQTNVGKMISMRNSRSPINDNEIRTMLVRISDLLIDIPELVAMDINPLLADGSGTVIIDARMSVQPSFKEDERLSIRPYPRELEDTYALKNGIELSVRPIKPEDEPNYIKLLSLVSQKDLRMRFFSETRDLPKGLLAQLIHIDYDREMAFVAVLKKNEMEFDILGVVNINATNDRFIAEYSILVRSDMKGQGLGRYLMEKIIHYCRDKGMKTIFGIVNNNNSEMIRLTEKLGFKTNYFYDDDIIEVRLDI